MGKEEQTSAAEFLPKRRDLESLHVAARSCEGCDLYKNATQTVFGEGAEHALCKELSVIGYVLNRPIEQISLASDTNREVLFNLTGVPCLAELPFLTSAGSEGVFPIEQFEKEFALRLIESFLS